jgi:hypothetical protein
LRVQQNPKDEKSCVAILRIPKGHQILGRRRTRHGSSKAGFASLLIVEVLRNLSDFEFRMMYRDTYQNFIKKNFTVYYKPAEMISGSSRVRHPDTIATIMHINCMI